MGTISFFEGFEKSGDKEYVQFLYILKRLCGEVNGSFILNKVK
jgi:hypothetical protein